MIDIEVLRLALSMEKDAIRIYQKLSVEHPNLKDLLSLLVIEEQKHKELIEKKIAQVDA